MLNIIGAIVILGIVLLGLGVFGSLLDNDKMVKISIAIAFIGGAMIILPLMIALIVCFM